MILTVNRRLHQGLILAAVCLSIQCVSAHEDQVPASAPSSLNWELKGVRLGDSLEEVQGLLPAANCETESFDSSLTTCTDWNNSLAGKKALVIVKLLDRRAVYICVDNLSLDQAQAGAVALVEKFGPASSVTRMEGQVTAHQRETNRWVYANQYKWQDGEITLRVDPFSWTDRKRQLTYAAVVLKDEVKHDQQWIIRYNGHGRKAEDI